MIGELLEHMGTRFDLAVVEVGRDFDPLQFLPGAIFERIFEGEVDEAADLLAVPDRNLAGDQRGHADWLKGGQEVAHPAVRLVDAVDEDQVRDAELVERAEGRGSKRRPRRVGIDDDDGEVGDGDRPRPVGGEADRAGDVDDRILVAEIIEIVEVELGGAAALPRLGARIAGAGAVGRRPQAVGGSGCEQHRFGQAGLSRAGGSHQRDDSGAFG